MGGASATTGSEDSDLIRRLHRAAAARFPLLGEIAWQYGWSGYLALTPDRLPVIHKHAQGMYSAFGCNGRGIAMATATGGLLADLVDGSDEHDCAAPVRATRHFFGYSLRRPAVAVAVRVNRALDLLQRYF